jgi:hypothetical protein
MNYVLPSDLFTEVSFGLIVVLIVANVVVWGKAVLLWRKDAE